MKSYTGMFAEDLLLEYGSAKASYLNSLEEMWRSQQIAQRYADDLAAVEQEIRLRIKKSPEVQ